MTALGDFLGKWGTSSCSLCKSPPCRVSFFSFMGGMLVGEQSHSETPALVSALGQSANRVGLSPQHWLFLLHLESRLILLESLSRMCRGIGKLPTSLPPPLNKERKKERKWSRSVVSDSLWPHGLQPTRLLRPWDFPGKSTGVGCHFLLQGIFLTQGSNPGLPHCKQTLDRLSHQGSPLNKDNPNSD